MDSELYLSFDGPGLSVLVVRVVTWAVVALTCLVAVRRPWAWPGLTGGLLGTAAATTRVVDQLQVRDQHDGLGAHVFDSRDLPGFVVDRGLAGPLDWAETAAVGLVALSLLVAAVLSRRRAQRA